MQRGVAMRVLSAMHDSLMVPGEMEREVEKVILSQWEEFGGTPKIDTKLVCSPFFGPLEMGVL